MIFMKELMTIIRLIMWFFRKLENHVFILETGSLIFDIFWDLGPRAWYLRENNITSTVVTYIRCSSLHISSTLVDISNSDDGRSSPSDICRWPSLHWSSSLVDMWNWGDGRSSPSGIYSWLFVRKSSSLVDIWDVRRRAIVAFWLDTEPRKP